MTSNDIKFSRIRSTIQTAFYRNNVVKINSIKEAYKLAKDSPGTIVTDMSVYKPEELGLDTETKVLLFNDGLVTGRCAAARKIIGEAGIDTEKYAGIVREAVYNTRYKTMYYAQVYIGLDKDFMVKAHLLIPQGHENILYNWMLNFQIITDSYKKMYKASKVFPNEGDIYIFGDPDWQHEEHPLGLTLFDPENNCAALLGMRYFGEFKKGTLTLGWGTANRNGYAACHGGQKKYTLSNGKSFVVGVFGLSGSGKSTLTHEKHNGKYDIAVLHDDAFIISTENGSSVALEPSYFDKTQDYPADSPDNKYLLTAQNCGAMINEEGKCILVTEDIRNGNGRAIKSKLWAPNRVNKFKEPVNAIIWLMKDPTLPPVLKINNPELATVMGATLATKRTTAERLAKGVDMDALVIEPYANPFRTYPLSHDYKKYKELFTKRNVECYIFNTGFFMDKKISKEVTIQSLEKIVEGSAQFKQWGSFSDIEILEIEGFMPNMNDKKYIHELLEGIAYRIAFIESRNVEKEGRDKLPEEAADALKKLMKEIKKCNIVFEVA
ncbi:phosphoenolpyruvate carboxykinase (ATP) [Crassaminicella indica]|uniref:Phosphoenolpyruvate carboxykinase (ATP) n=1 Tax=Crassaminicella indica TaxID=2855394 RepID=A0ABX8RB33_9CLOT|nr:phosphoenolpyruvate carboxykinase (ATP) [Crassaminicella indica]QXM05120.1 phosphoenolpyruvate carboxykinase (ATP) [Crassaminicella indica]